MHTLSDRQRLEIGAYIVTLSLAVPCFVAAALMRDSTSRDFLINLSATFAGAGFLFFLLNRFFGLQAPSEDGKPPSAIDFFIDDFPDMRERFGRARTIAISGITLISTSNNHWVDMRSCIERGGSVRVLMVNPSLDSPAIQLSAYRFYKHQDIEKIRQESLRALDNFETLATTAGQTDSFQLRLSSAVVPFGIWLIDANTRDAEIYAEVYSFRAQHEPVLHLLPVRDGKWYDYMQEQFELLWASGDPWMPASRRSDS